MLTRFIIFLFLLSNFVHAESIKSITGNIIFDTDNNGTSEAHLSSDGLAIGAGLSPSANLHLQGNGIVTGDLVIGGTAGNSTLEVQGTIGFGIQTVSSNTTLSGNSIVLVDTSSDNIIVTLPYAGNVTGRQYRVKKTSTSNQITLAGGGNNIDDAEDYTFSSGNLGFVKVISDGNQWYTLELGDGVTSNTVVASENLVGWWKLDESSGTTAADSSGQNNDMTLTNGPTWVSGKIDNALDFDGSNDYSIASYNSVHNTNVFSATVWAKATGGAGNYRSPFTSRDDFKGFSFYAASNNTWQVYTGDGATPWNVSNGPAVSLNTWTHLAVTGDGTTIKFYVNGSEVDSDSFGYSENPANGAKIGASDNGDNTTVYYFNGEVDDARIYNKELSASEVLEIYNNGQ